MPDVNHPSNYLSLVLNKLFPFLEDSIFTIDLYGNIELINKAAENLCDVPQNEIRGKHYSIFFHFVEENDQKPELENLIKNTANGLTLNHSIFLLKKNNYKIPVKLILIPLMDESGKLVGGMVILKDATKNKRLEEAEYNFVSMAAHQLRSPLGSMKWSMELLLNGDIGNLTPEVKNIVLANYHNNEKLIHLVNDLLNASRIGEGKIREYPVLTNIVDIINGVLHEVQWQAKIKKIGLEYKIKAETIPQIYIDPKLFHEVIENLISNALKYNKFNGKIVMEGVIEGDSIRICVADTGIGIPQKDQQNIFSKFFRASNSVSNSEGTGLGLYAAKSFVEGWGGKIWFESTENVGSKFTVLLPLTLKRGVLDRNLTNN